MWTFTIARWASGEVEFGFGVFTAHSHSHFQGQGRKVNSNPTLTYHDPFQLPYTLGFT
jgi:hypothetical protein